MQVPSSPGKLRLNSMDRRARVASSCGVMLSEWKPVILVTFHQKSSKFEQFSRRYLCLKLCEFQNKSTCLSCFNCSAVISGSKGVCLASGAESPSSELVFPSSGVCFMINVAEQEKHSSPLGLITHSRCKKFTVVLTCWKLGSWRRTADEAWSGLQRQPLHLWTRFCERKVDEKLLKLTHK